MDEGRFEGAQVHPALGEQGEVKRLARAFEDFFVLGTKQARDAGSLGSSMQDVSKSAVEGWILDNGGHSLTDFGAS